MGTTGNIPIVLMALSISLMSPIMADFETVKNSCSKPCQLTADSCKLAAQLTQPLLTNNCDLIQASINGISAHQCLVKNGFCTENEFVKLKNEACGVNEAQKTVSTATSVFYQSLSATTEACQRQALTCVQGSSVATVLKQQEHYCDLVNIATDVSSSQICLTSGCSFMELNRIGIAACSSSTAVKNLFARAVVEASRKCKGALETCSASSDTALAFIQSEQYCGAMNIDNQGKTTKMCLVDSSKCTQSEFDNLKIAACGVVPDYSFLSKICQLSVDHCRNQAQSLNPGLTDSCRLLKSTFNEVSAFQCLVKTGFCTENEFIKIKNDACGLYETQQTLSTGKTMIYRAISAAKDACQRRVLECVIGSRVATVLKQQEKYCALMDISTDVSNSQQCLTASNGCSSAEFSAIKTAACSSTPTTPSDFSNEIIASSRKCKGAMERCTESNDIAIALIQSEQYCKVMSLANNGKSTYSCLVDMNKCREAEFDKMKVAACGIIPGLTSVSKLCQMTVEKCRSQAQYVYPGLTDACKLLKSTYNEVTAFQCLVKTGFCNENEFVKIKNEACGLNEAQRTTSTAKTMLYKTLSTATDVCQRRVLECVLGSRVATVLKQQEKYCALMDISTDVSNSQQCLTASNGCSSAEFSAIKTAACSSTPTTPSDFSNEIIASSKKCKGAMEQCTESNDIAVALIQSEQYCKVMSIQNNGVTTYSCLVESPKCSQAEFDALKLAACGVIPGYASVSKLCQITVDNCRSDALFLNPELTDTCKLLKSTFNGVTAFQCLVNIGFCTESEYISLVKDSCGSSEDQITASAAKTSLYNTLSSTAESCQRSALLCIEGSSVATVMKQQENYCDMWKMFKDITSLSTCLTTSGCSSEVFNSIASATCSSPSPVNEGRFANAVVGTTSVCKVALETCTSSSDTSLSLMQNEEYCKVMSIDNKGATTQACLVADSRCTKSEFDSLKQAACSGVSMYVNYLLLLIPLSVTLL